MAYEAPFSTGLFDCLLDSRSCCTTFWCACVTFGRIKEITDKGESSCCGSATCYTLLAFPGLACLYSCCNRTKLRHQYSLRGSTFTDFCAHCCCELCALCQEYRELQNRGFDMHIGWEGNVAVPTRGVTMAPDMEGAMKR